MAIVTINDTTLTNIANAIRGRSGSEAGITPENMATEISNLPAGGDLEVKYAQVIITDQDNGKLGPFNVYDYVDSIDNILGLVVRTSYDYNNKANTMTYLKGMKTWQNQKFTPSGANTSTALQSDNGVMETPYLNDSANITSFYGLVILEDGTVAMAFYNNSSNYQCLTGYASSWNSAYARIEITYV